MAGTAKKSQEICFHFRKDPVKKDAKRASRGKALPRTAQLARTIDGGRADAPPLDLEQEQLPVVCLVHGNVAGCQLYGRTPLCPNPVPWPVQRKRRSPADMDAMTPTATIINSALETQIARSQGWHERRDEIAIWRELRDVCAPNAFWRHNEYTSLVLWHERLRDERKSPNDVHLTLSSALVGVHTDLTQSLL